MARELHEEEAARLAAIVSSSDDAIISKTLDGIITTWNASAERLFGYTAEEMIGRPITTIIPPDLLSEEQHIIAKLRRGERVEHFETVRLGKNGRRLELSITVSPMLDASGEIFGASKVARDISERKRAERVERLLIDELNHRIKNTLATVHAIAQQTLRRARDPEQFVQSFNGRIQALSRAHALLTGHSFQTAELSEIVREQVAIEGWDRTRTSWSGPVVQLESQPALHLSLILHELGTNARKHGALSTPAGKVNISWRIENGAAKTLRLVWEETGGPEVAPPTSRGFGSTLIEQSLAGYDSAIDMDFRPSGLVFTLTLPLPERTLAEAMAPDAMDPAARAATPARTLLGKRILVVEDEPLIAMTLADDLADLGCTTIGPAHSLERALALIEDEHFDAALLDGISLASASMRWRSAWRKRACPSYSSPAMAARRCRPASSTRAWWKSRSPASRWPMR